MFSLKSVFLLLLIAVVFVGMVESGTNVFPVKIKAKSNGGNSTMILAEKRTRRKDPLNDFKYYNGGWNFSDHHYFSVSFIL